MPGPAQTPFSPPKIKIPSPSIQPGKRKLPDFFHGNKDQCGNEGHDKKICFQAIATGDSQRMLETGNEENKQSITKSVSNALNLNQTMVELLRLEQMHDVYGNLSRECEARKRSVRLDSGEIMESETPTSSQGSENSNCSFAFDLAESTTVDEVSAEDIFDFIWKYAPDHQRDIYRCIGAGHMTRESAENCLRSSPRVLLQILETSLAEAEKRLNRFSV